MKQEMGKYVMVFSPWSEQNTGPSLLSSFQTWEPVDTYVTRGILQTGVKLRNLKWEDYRRVWRREPGNHKDS